MPKKGGQTTFSGTKFQAEITTLYLGRLIDPRQRGDDQMVIEVRPEADVEAEVDDILVRFKDGHTEWMQVKENIENSGKTWKKMWLHFEDQLGYIQNDNDRIVLILGYPRPWSKNLRETCERAESAKNSQEWLKDGQLNQEQRKLVESLRELLGKSHAQDLYELMRHIDLRDIDADRIREDLGPNWMPESKFNPLDLYDKLYVVVDSSAEKGQSIDRQWLLGKLANEGVQINSAFPWLEEPIKLKSYEPEAVIVPAGEFLMGSDSGDEYEKPQFSLELPAYRIGKFPVTNKQYAEFLRRSVGYDAPHGWYGYKPPPGKGNHPVAGVSWYDALAYCEWLTSVTETGGTYLLPSEAQWEKAARGSDGRLYPWGNEWPENPPCNLDDRQTKPVDEYPEGVSTFGCYDLVGNVREWTRSLWGYESDKPDDEYRYEWEEDLHNDNDGQSDAQVRRVYRGRGEPWYQGPLRASLRASQLPQKRDHAGVGIGFRIVLVINNS